MHATLITICTALDVLSKQVLAAWADDRTLREAYGWHHPILTRQDLEAIPRNLAVRIRANGPDELDASMIAALKDVPRRLGLLQGETVNYMFNGNGHQAVPAYLGSLSAIESTLEPLLSWVRNPDSKSMPPALARRLRSYEAELDAIAPDSAQLKAQVKQIEDATVAAESLPTDLEALKAAKVRIEKYLDDAGTLFGKLDSRGKDVVKLYDAVKMHEGEASKLVDQCEEAYRITTTKGLAAAFEQRSMRLGASMWVWVVGLLAALIATGYLGLDRVKALTDAVSKADPSWGAVLLQVALAALSVGAPLWFAWVATKQIGERFRLAEDYGFKASVAKAYEGYRKEAARIDKALEARLFSSALSRLEEAPLRLVDGAAHGSPWHELISSTAFRDAVAAVPALGEKLADMTQRGMSAIKFDRAPAKVPESASTASAPMPKI